MKVGNWGKFIFCIMAGILINGLAATGAQASGSGYTYKVNNTTNTAIKEILVSEDGNRWGKFNIGSGIKPGETVTLEWDKSTNNEDCKQLVKAVFKDGSVSEAAEFDFCENNLELEF
jgi:hypothetical protein